MKEKTNGLIIFLIGIILLGIFLFVLQYYTVYALISENVTKELCTDPWWTLECEWID